MTTTFPSGASLVGTIDPDARGVAVLMHGASFGFAGMPSWMAPAPYRMQLFESPIIDRTAGRVSVLRLRYPDRDLRSVFRGALRDTAAALEHIRRTAPQARIGLIGHSNGGRVALRLSSDARVDAVAALAPWLSPADRINPRPGVPVLLMHGGLDVVTSPQLTTQLAARLARKGVDVDHETVAGENHYLLASSAHWHDRVASFAAAHLL